jgi:2-polyprenyl-6-methoxyphenol hydroxylase-like FAD-dependent oxidoreductase
VITPELSRLYPPSITKYLSIGIAIQAYNSVIPPAFQGHKACFIFQHNLLKPMENKAGNTALVIGGSMAGLLAARVLSEHFEKVIILERDLMHDEPESRKGQPQTRHLHGLLAQGYKTIIEYFPDLIDGLKRGGNPIVDMGQQMRWFCYGGYRTRFTFDLSMQGIITSRPFLEWQIRQRVLNLPNVQVKDGYSAQKLISTSTYERIIGVHCSSYTRKEQVETLSADLVVDAGGRGSQSPKWLAELGYHKPKEDLVTCGVGYATRLFQRNPNQPGSQDWILITPDAPRERRVGTALPIEGERWIVSLGGWHGDHAPADEAGFIAFAKSLPAPDVYHIVSRCTPISDIIVNKFPASLRRRYEQLNRFPEGYLILGDAVCSFNPLYGQGMTTAALQARELDKLLVEQKGDLKGIARLFFRRIAKIIDIPWQMTTGEDFRFPQTQGKKAPGTNLINAYVGQVHRASHHDPVVGAAFLRAMNLMEAPSSLFHPRILWRVGKSLLVKQSLLKPTEGQLANV